MARVGLLGGTFDPVHAGHLALARECARELRLDRVHFVTNRRPPHKPPAVAGEHDRHAMVALATADEATFVADAVELGRPGFSYTVDTLSEWRERRPDDELHFLAGADSLADLPSWHRWKDILDACTFVAVGRGGRDASEHLESLPDEARRDRIVTLDCQPPSWSSSHLRDALAAGDASVHEALPSTVLDYLTKNALYARRAERGDS